MKPPYLKIVYTHLSTTGQRVLYVGNDGVEVDISNVFESVKIAIAPGDITRGTLVAPFVVTQTEANHV